MTALFYYITPWHKQTKQCTVFTQDELNINISGGDQQSATVNKMTTLCEIKSVAFYRNKTNFAVYFVAKEIRSSKLFSAKICLSELTPCLFEQQLDFKLGGVIGKHKISEKVGKELQYKDIDRYQLLEFNNIQRTLSYTDQYAPISREDSG